jgi:hypothetical protein
MPLLKNFRFDTGTENWMPGFNVTLTRSSSDASGGKQSGSLDLVLARSDATVVATAAASQCLPAASGAVYDLEAQILVPTAQGVTLGRLDLWYYKSADCSGSIAGTLDASGTGAAP